jgi:hypothetical protein
LPGLRLCVTAVVFLLLPALTAAAQKSISKSVEQGWNSVIKDASKAARQVSKAANDALAPKKGRKKKSAKRKTGDGKTGDGKAGDGKTGDQAGDGQAATGKGEAAEADAKPDAKDTAGRKPPGSNQTRDEAADADAEAWAQEPARTSRRTREPEKAKTREQARKEKENAPAALPPMRKSREPEQSWTAERAGDEPETPGTAGKTPAGTPKDKSGIPTVDIVPIKPKDGKASERGQSVGTGNPAQQPKLPITMIPPKPEPGTAEAAPPDTWSKEEIEAAKASCAAILERVDAVTIPEAPVREGNCGAPAPVRLVSIGKDPQVALSPPPLVTCDLVAGLHDWMKNDIQPLSRKQFGGPVIKIETMSDYSCRMAYGRKGNKLSEHGRANALDIRGFVTGKGETAYLLEHWGKTVRDLAAEAAAQAAASKAADDAADAAAAAGAKSATVQDKSSITVSLPAGAARATSQASLGPAGPGKKAATEAHGAIKAAPMLNSEPKTKKAQFLHDAQKSACRIFGTTLGPESNEAHRNHFHVDMAARKRTRICE